MMSHCDSIAERVALGEPLAELAEHAATCARCQRVIEMPARLGATHHEVDPGLGFAARITAGAQQRIAVRRRRRLAAGLAATVAAGMVGVFAITREPPTPAPAPVAVAPVVDDDTARDLEPPAVELEDAELAGLVRLADTKRSRRLSAHWARIQRPLAPYKQLVKGEAP